MPPWDVWARTYESGELANTTLFQPFRMNTDTILKAVRTWFVVFNNPTFTDLNAKIYSDEIRTISGTKTGHTPVTLLHTSTDSRTKAELHTSDYGVKETYFTFNEVPLQGDTWYNLVINGTGYSPTASSYLAWKHAYPDPVLTGYTAAVETINSSPFQIYFIGGDY